MILYFLYFLYTGTPSPRTDRRPARYFRISKGRIVEVTHLLARHHNLTRTPRDGALHGDPYLLAPPVFPGPLELRPL
jgi:hypothetical protein